jgi:hypothetical protein
MAPGPGRVNPAARTAAVALLLGGCARLDAQEFPIPADAGNFQLAADQAEVLVAGVATGHRFRAISQYDARAPRIESTTVGETMQASSECAGAAGCAVSWFLDLPPAMPGSVSLQEGSVQLGAGYTAELVVALDEGTITGAATELSELDVTGDATVDVGLIGEVTRVSVVSVQGDVDLEVPAGAWRLSLDGGSVDDGGLVDDPAAARSITITTGGAIRLMGR